MVFMILSLPALASSASLPQKIVFNSPFLRSRLMLSKELLSKERVILVSLCAVSALLVSASVLGRELGLYDAGVGDVLTIFTCVVLMFVTILYYSVTVHRIDLQRKKAEADLAEKERRYRDLFDHGQGLICTHDIFGTITAVNPAALLSLGYSREEMVGQNLRDLLPEERRLGFDAYLRKVVHEGEDAGLLTVVNKRGKTLFWGYHNVLVSEPGKEPYVLGHAQDVTQLIEAQRALKNLSLTDELTGLYNRRGFLTLAEQQVKLERHESSARGLVLLFADMDDLKKINDDFGHEVGSKAIVAFSRILKTCLRTGDLIARWGGDEFVILTIGSRDENVSLIIERINKSVDEYNAESGKPYKLACSIGFTSVDVDDGENLEAIIAEADKAMYAEKRLRKVKSYTQADRSISF